MPVESKANGFEQLYVRTCDKWALSVVIRHRGIYGRRNSL